MKLGELLVQNGLITKTQLREALEAQLVFGGRLGTNLVELGMTSTASLAEFLARQLEVGSLEPSELDFLPEEARLALPVDLVERYQIVPLRVEKRTLTLAMADPTDLAAVDAVAFHTGLRIVPVVAPELLVLYALEKFYGITRPNRYIRVGEAFDQTGFDTAAGFGHDVTDAVSFAIPAPRQDDSEAYGLREAAVDLVSIDRHSQALDILRRAVHTAFERVVILALDDRSARIWGQVGCEIPPEIPRTGVGDPVQGFEIPLEQSRLFLAIAHMEAPAFEPHPRGERDALLLRLLGAPQGEPFLALPIRPRGRSAVAVALAAAPRTPATDPLVSLGLLASKTADALDLVRLKRRILAV